MRLFAKRIIALEASANQGYSTENQAAVAAVQRLRPVLEELMGNTGFRALVARSLSMAKEEFPLLSSARMNADGMLEGFDNVDSTDEVRSGGEVMLAWLLGLLGSFIGELLTMELVLDAWPNLTLQGYFLKGLDI